MDITTVLVILTAIPSIAAFSNREIIDKFAHNPYQVHYANEYYRLLTSGFLHANWIHLIINMLVFFSFGKAVEVFYLHIFGFKGKIFFLMLYLLAIVVSDLPTLVKQKSNPAYTSLGASGAVSAIVFASIALNPWSKIYIWGVLPVPGIVLGVLYLVYSARMGQKAQDNINHDAHFYGAVFGLAFTFFLKPALFFRFLEQLIIW